MVAIKPDFIDRDRLEAEFPGGTITLEHEISGAGRVDELADELRAGVGEVVLQLEHAGCSVPILLHPFADADVSGHEVVLRRNALEGGAFDGGAAGRTVILVQRLEGRIALAVKRCRGFGEAVAHGFIHHVMPDGGMVETAAVEFDGIVTVHKDVVDDLVVTAPAQECGTLHLVEQVAEDFGAADAVVHINTHRAHPDTAGVMNEIVADAVATEGVVAPGVDGADVAGLECDVMNLIELDEVVVAGKEDGAVRVVVDEVVGGALADAADRHCGDVALGPAALARKMAVLDEVRAGLKCLAIAAR